MYSSAWVSVNSRYNKADNQEWPWHIGSLRERLQNVVLLESRKSEAVFIFLVIYIAFDDFELTV